MLQKVYRWEWSIPLLLQQFPNRLTFFCLFKLLIIQCDAPKKTTVLSLFWSKCLYTTLSPKGSSSNSLLWHSRFSNIQSTPMSTKLNILFFFPFFLTLLLPGKCTPRLSVCLSVCFSSYKSFNTFLYYLPSIWPGIILPSYVDVL